ncbi:MAG: methylated-DNA--[protein]-cysteine S-methyltransferase [Planctomycetaceae bacterium]|nr:methylated-DNA--[protein]-cysteine S-methyltransferase [Planctomycetaceae bacterium]
MKSDYETIQSAIEFVRLHAVDQPSLGQIAAHVSLSPAYLQRLFRRWAGISPKRWLQFLNAAEAKRLLRDSVPVLDVAFAVGFSGPGRLHDLLVSTEAVTPGEYAQRGLGVEIRYGWGDSPFGHCLIAWTQRGICALRFADSSTHDQEMASIRNEWPSAHWLEDSARAAQTLQQIFIAKHRRPLLLDLQGTNFQLKVWNALLHLPEGSVVSYSSLADRLDTPTATRAVASAVGANPIAYLIPCHRVLRSSGELGGYRWGLDRKMAMLSREMAHLDSGLAAADPPSRR